MAFSQVLTCFGLLPAPCPSFFPPGQEALLPHQLSLRTMMKLKQNAGAVAVQDGATSSSPVVEGTEGQKHPSFVCCSRRTCTRGLLNFGSPLMYGVFTWPENVSWFVTSRFWTLVANPSPASSRHHCFLPEELVWVVNHRSSLSRGDAVGNPNWRCPSRSPLAHCSCCSPVQ